MKVFCDLHHGSLYYSLQLLFEKRLGWELYRPIGMEWYHEKFWTIADPYPEPLNTAGQYLGTDHEEYVPYKQLNGDYKLEDGIYYVYDPDHDIHQKAIRLDEFKKMDIGIVIASYLGNVTTFRRLVDLYKPKAKLIHQMGNNWIDSVDFGLVQNIMASTKAMALPQGINAVFYHQEFDVNEFTYTEQIPQKRITCLMNNLNSYPDAGSFFELEKAMPDWQFKSFGASNRDDSIAGYKKVAQAIKDSMFIWHIKIGGDGYGHILHNAFACGRPPIVKKEYYHGQLGEELMKDGDTCICVDGLKLPDIAKKIEYYSDPVRYKAMSMKAFHKFNEKVDFNKEAEKLKNFLEVLI